MVGSYQITETEVRTQSNNINRQIWPDNEISKLISECEGTAHIALGRESAYSKTTESKQYLATRQLIINLCKNRILSGLDGYTTNAKQAGDDAQKTIDTLTKSEFIFVGSNNSIDDDLDPDNY